MDDLIDALHFRVVWISYKRANHLIDQAGRGGLELDGVSLRTGRCGKTQKGRFAPPVT